MKEFSRTLFNLEEFRWLRNYTSISINLLRVNNSNPIEAQSYHYHSNQNVKHNKTIENLCKNIRVKHKQNH